MSDDLSVATALRRAPGFVRKTIERHAATRWFGWYFDRHPDHRALDADAAIAAARDADRILFLCWGNICRSPLAARYLEARLDERGIDGVAVDSAGLGEYDGRESPTDAIDAAERRGVDLADHRSVRAEASGIARSDVIFLMDYHNYHLLAKRFPGAVGKTFFLGALAEDGSGDVTIPDPHGHGRERFDAAYASIADGVETLVEAIAAGRRGTAEASREE